MDKFKWFTIDHEEKRINLGESKDLSGYYKWVYQHALMVLRDFDDRPSKFQPTLDWAKNKARFYVAAYWHSFCPQIVSDLSDSYLIAADQLIQDMGISMAVQLNNRHNPTKTVKTNLLLCVTLQYSQEAGYVITFVRGNRTRPYYLDFTKAYNLVEYLNEKLSVYNVTVVPEGYFIIYH